MAESKHIPKFQSAVKTSGKISNTTMTQIKNNAARYWHSLDESWRLALVTFLVARLFYFLWSWLIFTIQPIAIQNFVQAGEPILTIFKLENSEAHVYLRNVGAETLTFRPTGTDQIVDQQTGSVWDISTGTAIQGQYKNTVLATAKTLPSDIFPYNKVKPYPGIWLAMWQRFDANWYLSVAENRYGSIPGDDHFPPLFPLLIRIFRPIFGSAFRAGLFIAHIATLYALKLLYDRFKAWGEETTAKRSFLFFAIYPTSFFLFSVYSEPIFLVAALLALQAMKQRSWVWAGFWIFCAVSTRLQGVALLPPMLYLMWQDQPFLRKPAHWMGLFVAGLGGLFYLYLRSTQVTNSVVPLVESDWHARLVPPWETYLYAIRTIVSGTASFIDMLNWGVVTIFIVIIIWSWRRIPLEYNFYAITSLLIVLIRIVETQPLISASRYSLTLFPVFFSLGLAGNSGVLRRVILYTSILLNLYLSAQFFLWGWVA
jgi:hypothetical protein